MESIVYTPHDVSTMLRIRMATVYQLIQDGELPAIRIGKNYKIPKKAFDEWLDKRTVCESAERKGEA